MILMPTIHLHPSYLNKLPKFGGCRRVCAPVERGWSFRGGVRPLQRDDFARQRCEHTLGVRHVVGKFARVTVERRPIRRVDRAPVGAEQPRVGVGVRQFSRAVKGDIRVRDAALLLRHDGAAQSRYRPFLLGELRHYGTASQDGAAHGCLERGSLDVRGARGALQDDRPLSGHDRLRHGARLRLRHAGHDADERVSARGVRARRIALKPETGR